jgi:hypothetical protein
LVELTTGQLVTPALREKEAMQADAKLSRPATISAMTNARGWMTFAGFISCLLLCERGSHICKVLDITKHTSALHPRTAQQREVSAKSGWRRSRRPELPAARYFICALDCDGDTCAL